MPPMLPIMFNDHWNSMRPSRLLDQHFGMGLHLDDFMSPIQCGLVRSPAGYYRPWCSAAAREDSGSTITSNKDEFQVNLDVQQFKPDEISVKARDNTITVEGKHEEKEDEHGFVYRHFIRRYILPEGHDVGNVVSNLSSDGVLSITAPRVGQIEGHRTIPIQQTGVPSKPLENKKQNNEANQKKE